MAPIVGFRCVFLARSTRRGLLATALDYWGLSRRTWRLLRDEQPRVLWLQLPPVALLWVALAARRILRPDMKLVADCHNAMFRPPWSRVPAGVRWLGHCDLVLVHNEAVRSDAIALGVPEHRLHVLEDVPPKIDADTAVETPAMLHGRSRPWVLFPGSFAADEPINEVLAAAASMPDATFIITGRTERAARHGHDLSGLPPNVLTPGFVELPDFDKLMRAADVVLALTRFEGVQLSVCNEALGYGKAMVVSDTAILRTLFASACELVSSHEPAMLAQGIRRAYAQLEPLSLRARALAQSRTQHWRAEQFEGVLAALQSAGRAGGGAGGSAP
jgi:glycosyltransferase involved in cell wall biosynthesis